MDGSSPNAHSDGRWHLANCTYFAFEPLGTIELMIDLLSHRAYKNSHKGINIYFILKLVSQLALFHHGTEVTPLLKAKVFRCKLLKS